MILALGVFDGVHLGHQAIIKKADKVLTFHPHPDKNKKLLTTIEERSALISNLEILKFDNYIASLSPELFIKDYLLKKFNLQKIVVGYDFKFGYQKSGDINELKRLGKKYKFEVEVLSPVTIDGLVPKSSTIRNHLKNGQIADANKLLGRHYCISGTVVHGKKLGRVLGFPTANLRLEPNKLIPGTGVYIGKKCVINIADIVEVHLLDFNGDLYDKNITVEFISKIREVKKFSNNNQLKKQIAKDVAMAKR